MVLLSSLSASHFNSHAHVERDSVKGVCFIMDIISTHTLTWSVTRQEMKKPCMNLHFNSHAHVERDFLAVTLVNSTSISTHTLTWSVT